MKKELVEESFLNIAIGIIMATAMLAMICGDGNKGILDLI